MSSIRRSITAAAFLTAARGLQSVVDKAASEAESQWKSLPEMNVVWSKPKAMVDEMGKNADTLEAHLNELQQHSNSLIAQQKADYELNLTTQRDGNKEFQKQNDHIAANISVLDKDIKHLRDKNGKLTKANLKLEEDIHSMQDNMSTAVEFLKDAVNLSESDLDNAEELKVLDELTKLDTDKASENDHKGKLDEVLAANAGEGEMSLLELGNAVRVHPKKPKQKEAGFQELIEMVTQSLSDLTTETNASEWSLHDQFMKQWLVGGAHKSALLQKQSELNTTEADAIELKNRLINAEEHLENTHEYLVDKAESVRSFNKQLSKKPVPGKGNAAISLLQTAMWPAQLAYKTVSTHVASLL